jgi:DegV family protein with EDD domain
VDVTPSEAYKLFLKDPEAWHSSAPSPMDFIKGYREASNQAKDILCITISSKLSTTYDAARVAVEQAGAELPGVTIEVLDSGTTTAAEGFVALAAARAAAEGKGLAEVIQAAEEMRKKVIFIAFLDTIKHVYRSGRIPKIASQVGSILGIKPILTISSGAGVVRFMSMARSREAGLRQIIKAMKSRVGSSPVHVAVMHAYAPEEAEKLKERVSSEFNCAELWVTEFSPLMGYACGTGTLGLSFYREG